jgi:ATP-binding cassette subfamily B protein
MVLQETFLFSDSVKENIRYGKLDASDDDVIAAAKDANAHELIMSLPQGYDTISAPKG